MSSRRPKSGFAGLLVVELHFPDSHSLKDKRAHLRSIKASMQRAGFSVSEVALHDKWQRGQIAVAVVGQGSGDIESRLDSAWEICDRIGCEPRTVHRHVLAMDEIE